MSDAARIHHSAHGRSRGAGITLIELMIVIAIIAIILTVALPVSSNYLVRARIGEGLNLAQSAVSEVCAGTHRSSGQENPLGPRGFAAGSNVSAYVESISTEGTCATPVITIRTRATGQLPDPVIVLSGQLVASNRQFSWRCSSDNAPEWLLPSSCRS